MDMYLSEILFGGFLLLLLLGAPITVALGGAAMGAYVVLDKDPIALVQIAFNSVGSFPLMALPAFVLAGALMEEEDDDFDSWGDSPAEAPAAFTSSVDLDAWLAVLDD